MNHHFGNREDIAWASGLFDGEGCICQKKDGYRAVLTLSMTDEDLVRRFHEKVGGFGTVTHRRPSKYGNKPFWAWRCSKREHVQAILAAFWCFLGERRREKAAEMLHRLKTTGLTPKQGLTCTEEGCEKPRSARGLCSMHYNRLRTHGLLEPLKTIDPGRERLLLTKVCMIDGCEERQHGAGLCNRHYYQQYKPRWREYKRIQKERALARAVTTDECNPT